MPKIQVLSIELLNVIVGIGLLELLKKVLVKNWLKQLN